MDKAHVLFEDQTIRFADSDTSRASDDAIGGVSKSRTISGYEWTKFSEENVPDPVLEEDASSPRNSVTQLLGTVPTIRMARPGSGIIEDGFETSKFGVEIKSPQSESVSNHTPRKRRDFMEIICGWIARLLEDLLSLIQGRTEDAEGVEVERGPIRYVPHSLSSLTRTTKFTKEELKTLYRTFKNECPTGVVYEETFKSIYSQFFPSGDANMYAHYLFNAFDNNEEGYICFEDFIISLSSLLRGEFEDKLQWVFKLYDINHDGFITKQEIQDIVKSVYSLLGPLKDANYSHVEHANRVFEKLDRNNDGHVSYPEFVDVCSKDPTVVASMKVFDAGM